MGLTISAYRGLTPAKRPLPESTNEEDIRVRLFVNHDFPGREGAIEDKRTYWFEDRYNFDVGSCTYYNDWREELARLAGYPTLPFARLNRPATPMHAAGAWAAKEGPFWEMINFADNTGVLGAEVAAKLVGDFAEFQQRALTAGDDEFRRLYAEFQKACQIAADRGAVVFH